jgi:hypothetical protein
VVIVRDQKLLKLLCLATTMRLIGTVFAFFASARAACDATLWQPKSGDTVQKAADVLGVDVDTFKHWNPQLEDVDNIHTKQTFTVSYTSALDGAVWTTKGCNRYLHLGGTPSSGYETSVASPTSVAGGSSTGAKTTLDTSTIHSPTSRSTQPSPRQSEDSTPRDSMTATTTAGTTPTTATTANTPTTTATTFSLADRPTKDASPTTNLVCGGSRDGPPLLCNPENDGTFFTNPDMLEKLVDGACKEHGRRFLSPGDVITYRMDDPDKSATQYEFMAYVVDQGDYHRRMPEDEDCRVPLRGNFWDCCNGGTGGATKVDGIVMQYHPLHQGKPPKDAYKIIESWP